MEEMSVTTWKSEMLLYRKYGLKFFLVLGGYNVLGNECLYNDVRWSKLFLCGFLRFLSPRKYD